MAGDERVRFCAQCEKNVYNLSALSRDDAEAFLRQREGSVCVRLFRRADGTVMTSDCPVGVRRRRRRRAVGLAIGGGLTAAAAVAMSAQSRTTMGTIAPAVVGSVEFPSPVMGEVRPEAVPSSAPAPAVGPGHHVMGRPSRPRRASDP